MDDLIISANNEEQALERLKMMLETASIWIEILIGRSHSF